MTMIDEAPGRTASAAPARPGARWVVLGLAVVVFFVGLFGLGYQSKLADVQKNDNSSFLPGSADSTKVANEQEKFATVQSIPGSIVYQRDGGLTTADKQAIRADVAAFKAVKGVSVDEVGLPEFKGDAANVSVPLIAKQNGKSVTGPDLVDAEKAVVKAARDGAPEGLNVHSAGA